MNPPVVQQFARRHVGRLVHIYDVVDSTNNRCVEAAANPENDGLVVIANSQTAGRGREGRRWECPPGQGVLLSMLVFPPAEVLRPVILTAWATTAVCRCIGRLGPLEPSVKWPNDVLIAGRKVCGVLMEQTRGVVVGIGLNLNQSSEEFTRIDRPDAASLRMFLNREFDPLSVADALIDELDGGYRAMLNNVDGLEIEWRQRVGLVGNVVAVEFRRNRLEGILAELGFDGAVIVDSTDTPHLVRPEDIRAIHRLQ